MLIKVFGTSNWFSQIAYGISNACLLDHQPGNVANIMRELATWPYLTTKFNSSKLTRKRPPVPPRQSSVWCSELASWLIACDEKARMLVKPKGTANFKQWLGTSKIAPAATRCCRPKLEPNAEWKIPTCFPLTFHKSTSMFLGQPLASPKKCCSDFVALCLWPLSGSIGSIFNKK